MIRAAAPVNPLIQGSNPASIKQTNLATALRIIRRGGASRAEISRQSHLSRGGLTPIVNELLAQRLIVECESVETDSGRPPVLLRLNGRYAKVICVVWIRDQAAVALVGIDGSVQSLYQYPFQGGERAQDVIDMIVAEIARILARERDSLLLGIMAQAPGPLDAMSGVILNPSNFNGWQNIPLVEILSERFPLPVFLENNLVGAAVAEQHFGYGRDIADFIYIVVDEGIGAGFVLNGQLYQGKSRQISEVGHISLDIHGEKCSCGNTGCAEMYVTVPALCRRALQIGPAQSCDWAATLREVLRRAEQGDAACRRALEREAEYLGSLIVTLINIFDIDTVVLGSSITAAREALQAPLTRYVAERISARPMLEPHIYFSRLQRSSIVGGALRMFDFYIDGRLGTYAQVGERSAKALRAFAAQ
ncbi:MAG TPA: ROK family protein [Candidatus Pullichristensenella avicola]|nr:ROK family protein [Candidatus Pullichristensenella avicola]